MGKSNIDLFNACVGVTLARLYEAFPVPIDLGFSDGDELIQEAPEGFAAASMVWLIEEGYVRGEIHDSNTVILGASGLVLTTKGLQLLSLPESLEKTESLGKRLMTAVAEGAIDGVGELTKQAITAFPLFAIQRLRAMTGL